MGITFPLIIVFIFISFIIIAVILGVYYMSKYCVVDKTGMIREYFACEYSEYGGMEGEELRILLEYDGSTSATVTVRERKCAGGDEEQKTCIVPIDAVYQIQNLYNMYGVDKWGKLPTDDIIILDAPVIRVTFETTGKKISIESTKKMPDKGFRFINEVHNVLSSYCVNE